MLAKDITSGINPLLIQHTQELFTLARQIDDDIAYHIALFYEVMIISFQNKNVEADKKGKELLFYMLEQRQDYFAMKLYNLLAINALTNRDYYNALENYLKSLQIANSHPEYQYLCCLYNNIGSLFEWLEDYEHATEYLEYAYHEYLNEGHEDTDLYNVVILNLVEVGCSRRQYDRVQYWANIANQYEFVDRLTLDALLKICKAYQAVEEGNIQLGIQSIKDFHELMENHKTEYIEPYLYYRCYLNAFSLSIQIHDKDLATQLLHFTQNFDQQEEASAFLFDLSRCQIYYQNEFILKETDNPYYANFFHRALEKVDQMTKTYIQSLLTQIELDKANEKNETILSENQNLSHNLELDLFTELYNKVSIRRHIEDTIKNPKSETHYALALMDIDLFKHINDDYGHDVGDVVIQSVANLLKRLPKDRVLAGRFGGDEFLVLFMMSDLPSILDQIDFLLSSVRMVALPNGETKKVSLSIGVTPVVKNESFDSLFLRADHALYQAKNNGRNRYCLECA